MAEIKVKQKKYYMISIDDPKVQKLTIQLTSIHGDPDMYVSTTNKNPSKMNFEKRSTFSGLYPDVITYEKSDAYNISNNYYIGIESWEDSTFSLVYFTEDDTGGIGTQKLLVGEKLRGYLHLNMNPTDVENPMLDQPSLTYHFSVSSLMLKDGKKIQVRLNAEHGEFMYLVAVDKVPDFDAKDFGNNEDAWVGGDLQNVVIEASDLDSKLEA